MDKINGDTVVLPMEDRARVDAWCSVMQERWDQLMLRNVDELDGELVSYARNKGSTNTTILKVQAGEDLVMEPWPLNVPEWAESVRIDALDWPEVNAAFEGVEHHLGNVIAQLCECHRITVEALIDSEPGSVDISGPEIVVTYGYGEARYSCRDAAALLTVLQVAAHELET